MDSPSPVLIPIREVAYPSVHLYCFHHAGGAATAFRTWKDRLRTHVAITAVLLPGRGRRFGEPPHTTLHAAAREAAAAIRTRPGDTHVVLFGHSLGGLVAFETCRLLERADRPPTHLFVSGAVPLPPREERFKWTDEALVELMRELGGTPDEVFLHDDLLELSVAVLRADLRLVDTYDPTDGPPVATPITAVTGEKDGAATPALVAKWATLTVEGDVWTQVFPGEHFYLQEREPEVLEWLQQRLTELAVSPTA